MLRFLFRGYLLIRRLRGSAHSRRRGGIWMAPRHRGRYYAARPRGRTNVRVGGCCLPIPLTFVAALAAGVRLAHRARKTAPCSSSSRTGSAASARSCCQRS